MIQIEKLSKSYGGVRALSDVSMDIRAGEVHGLCGENGAGKSTLIKCLAGVVEPDAGGFTINGASVRTGDIRAAEDAGIAVIHQESTSFPDLDLVDNLFVGRELRRGPWLDRAAMEAKARSVMDRLELKLDLRTPLGAFTIAQRQMVEMARALLRDCRLIIMDEPTASLSAKETELLLALVQQLRRDGVSVLYVSHRLEEIFAVADRVTVLRDGAWVATHDTSELNTSQLIEQMVGREVETLTRHGTHEGRTDHVRLQVRGLAAPGRFEDVSFEVHDGEILGLGGLVGAGRSEVARALFGVDAYKAGTVQVDGKPLLGGSVQTAMAAGIALVPEDRQHEGLVLPMTVSENITLAILEKIAPGRLLNAGREDVCVRQWMERLNIKAAGPGVEAASLSGGNQQKVVLGKWLATEPSLLILDEPTRGVDVGAKAEIHRLIRQLTAGGMATLVISSDLPELLALCDRIVVMSEGRIAGELDGATADEKDVLHLAFPVGERGEP